MEAKTIPQTHIAEMIHSKYDMYQLIELIIAKNADYHDVEDTIACLRDMVEFSLGQEMRIKKSHIFAIQKVFALGPDIAREAIRLWKKTLETNFPRRKEVSLLLNSFCEWLLLFEPKVRDTILNSELESEWLFYRISHQNIKLLIEYLNNIEDLEVLKDLIKVLKDFAQVSHNISLPATHLVWFQANAKLPNYCQEIRALLKKDNIDKDEVVNMVQNLSKILSSDENGIDNAMKSQTLSLVLNIANRQIGSAAYVAKVISKRLTSLPKEKRKPYLSFFSILIESNGIRIIGFSLTKLTTICINNNIDKVEDFITNAQTIGKIYGPTAGEWFLCLKTKASRKYDLSGGTFWNYFWTLCKQRFNFSPK